MNFPPPISLTTSVLQIEGLVKIMAYVGGASPMVNGQSVEGADATSLEALENQLEPLVRSLQSVSMKGEGNADAKDLLSQSVKLRRKSKKLKSRGQVKKAEAVLATLISRISDLLGGAGVSVQSNLTATAKEFVPKAIEAQQLHVHPSSAGQKVVPGVSTELSAALFLDAPVDLSELELEDDSGSVGPKDESKAPMTNVSTQSSDAAKGKSKSKRRRPKKWWQALTDSDPITMEPLCAMKYPPFELEVESTEAGRPSVSHYFDGKVLAHYIVSTGNFTNPNNRQDLTRSECVRLDKYLRDNHLPAANVADAFDLRRKCKVQTNSDAQSHMNMLQREATVVMQNLFQYRRGTPTHGRNRRDEGGGGLVQQRLVNPTVYTDGNLTVVDSNSWEAMDESRLQSLDDFPAMSAGGLRSSTVPAPQRPAWPRSNPSSLSQQEFPSLSSGAQVEQQRPGLQQDFSRIVTQGVPTPPAQNVAGNLRTRNTPVPSPQPALNSFATTQTKRIQFAKISEYTLCPYTPTLIAQARQFGLNWVRDVQARLYDFVTASNQARVMTPHFKVMSASKRRFIQTLCVMYYGLEATTMDREPNAWVQVTRSQNSIDFELSIAQALTQWPDLFASLSTQRSSLETMHGSSCVALWGVALSSSAISSNRTIQQAFDAFARPSEYNIVWCKPEHAIVEFVERKLARKVYARLKGKTSLGGLRWQETQWWPCGSSWAIYQLDQRETTSADSRRRRKELRQIEQVQNRLERERRSMRATAAHTGWDSDEDTSSYASNQRRANKSNKWDILEAE